MKNLILTFVFALGCALLVSGKAVELPKPVAGYATERTDIASVKKLSNITPAQKSKAEAEKKTFKASKAEYVTLPDGKTYLRLLDKKKRILLFTPEGKQIHTGSRADWSESISMIKVIGDDKNYYLELDVNDEELGAVKVVETTGGRYIASDYDAIYAYQVRDKTFFHTYSKKFTHSYGLHSTQKSTFLSSEKPYLHCDAIEGSTVTDKVNGFDITLPVKPKPECIVATDGKGVEVETLNEFGSTVYGNVYNLPNSGYKISCVLCKPVIKVSTTEATVMGKTKKGTQLEAVADDNSGSVNVFDPDGNKLVENCTRVVFSEPEQAIYYTKRDVFVKNMGVIHLVDSTLNIPAKFDNVKLVQNSEGKWLKLVNTKAFEPVEIYNPDTEYTREYRNEGEKHYSQGFYFFAYRDFLEMPLDSLTFQDCQLAVSAYTIAGNEHMEPVRKIVATYRQGIVPEGIGVSTSQNQIAIDLLEALWRGSYKSKTRINDITKRLVEIAPNDQKALAERLAGDAEMMSRDIYQLYSFDLKYAPDDCERVRLERERDRILAEQAAQQRAVEAAAEQARLNAERNQAIALAFLNGFSQVLQSSLSSHHKSAPAKSYSNSKATGKPSGGSSSASSSSDGDDGMHQIWVNERRAELKHEIDKSLKRLRNAEDNYAKNPTNAAKSAMESARRNYESYQQQYRDVK